MKTSEEGRYISQSRRFTAKPVLTLDKEESGKGVRLPTRSVQRRDDELAVPESIRTSIPSFRSGTHLTAVGVPLRKIRINLSVFSFRSRNPVSVRAITKNTPTTGRMTIFAIVVMNIAAIGRRERGRGSWMREKLTPRRMRASGTATPPRN